jgi:hypothetical protein
MAWRKYKRHYVYIYLENETPYYVGMGKNNRMVAKHLYVDVPDNSQIAVIDNMSEEQAWDLETNLIEHYGMQCNNTGILKNLRPGGKTQTSGWHHSDQAKKKISVGNTGKIRTADQRKNYKGTTTKEWAEKVRQANLGRKPDGRQLKGAIITREYKWFNNGISTKMCKPGTEPNGFVRGRKLIDLEK